MAKQAVKDIGLYPEFQFRRGAFRASGTLRSIDPDSQGD